MLHKSKLKYVFIQIIVLIFIAVYLAWGTYLYYVLEKNSYVKLCYDGQQQDVINRVSLSQTIVDYLKKNITQSDNMTEAISYVSDSLNNYATFVLSNRQSNFYVGQDCTSQSSWNIPNILLFALTIITSIGYGQIFPMSDQGKLAIISYSLLGIPLFLVFLRNLSECLGNLFRQFFFRVVLRCCNRKKSKNLINGNEIIEETDDINEKGVPLTVTLIIITLYLIIGGFIFSNFEQGWSFIASVYFSYISLATIGFGDLTPGQNSSDSDRTIKLVLGVTYILFGLGVLAMSFDLVERELIEKFVWLGKKIGLIKHDDDDNCEDEVEDETKVENEAEK